MKKTDLCRQQRCESHINALQQLLKSIIYNRKIEGPVLSVEDHNEPNKMSSDLKLPIDACCFLLFRYEVKQWCAIPRIP